MFQKNTTARLIFVIFRIFCAILALILVLALALPIGFYGMAMYIEPTLPKVDNLKTMPLEMPLQIYTADNKLIGQYGNRYSLPVTYEELPKTMINAFLAAEDASFFEHSGISVKGLGRAITQMVSGSDSQTGGSSITQQVAKNYFLSPEQTFERKLTEMYLARKIENEMTKDEIMTLYVNKIYLGQGAYGIKAAARRYFSKSLENLTIAEMAMLAGLPKAPSEFNPVVNPNRALERRNWIIKRMYEEGFINAAERDEAIAAPIGLHIYQEHLDLNLPYVSEMARDALVQMYGDNVMNSGWRVQLTIDSKTQQAAEQALQRRLMEYHRSHGNGWSGIVAQSGNVKSFLPVDDNLPAEVTKINAKSIEALLANGETVTVPWSGMNWAVLYRSNKRVRGFSSPKEMFEVGNIIRIRKNGNNWQLSNLPIIQGALASINPKNGALIAVAGGYHFGQSKFNRATQGYRQPGSTIKPLVYMAGLESGKFKPDSQISNAALKGKWQPKGAGGGTVSMRSAIAYSKNLPVVHVLKSVGLEPTRTLMANMGLEKERLPESLPLALGAADVTPLQMATAYSTFMNGGHRIQPYFIERIYTFGNDLVYQANPAQSCAICFNGTLEKLNAAAAKDFEQSQKAKQSSDDKDTTKDTAAENTDADTNTKDTAKNNDKANHGKSGEKSTKPNNKATNNETDAQAEDGTILDATPAHDRLRPKTAPVYNVAVQAPRIITAGSAANMADMLRGVVRGGTGKGALALGRGDIGGKTGTTNLARDVWFAGGNPANIAVVWMGFDNPAPIAGGTATGGKVALPIWLDFMRYALQDVPTTWVEGGDKSNSEVQKQQTKTITDDTPKEELPENNQDGDTSTDEGSYEDADTSNADGNDGADDGDEGQSTE